MCVLATIIGIYPIIYFIFGGRIALLGSKPDAVYNSLLWQVCFYTHILGGGIALLSGWPQFSNKLRQRRVRLHRNMGKVYMVAVWLSALTGIYIGWYANGGVVAAAGFVTLGIIWFYTTLKAYLHILQRNVAAHRQMMVYSYACTFAAVTLRIWLPLLSIATGDGATSYIIVSWLCWVPNIAVAAVLHNRRNTDEVFT